MKRWFIRLLSAVLIVSASLTVFAAPPGGFAGGPGGFKGGPPHLNQIREDARRIVHRTAMVLIEARRAAERRHRYAGLGMAVANQQTARRLFFNGAYRDAIFHSLRARDIAFRVIRENRGRIRPEFFRDPMEERYGRGIPRNEELDRRIDKGEVQKDEDSIHINIDLDL